MGYGITPVINVQIDNDNLNSLIERDSSFGNAFDKMLENLRAKQLTIPKIKSNPIFFEKLQFYNQFAKIILNFSNTKEYILDEDYYVSSPAEVFEILIAIRTLSLKIPDAVFKLGIGDIAVFWADFTLKNGELINIKFTRKTNEGDIQDINDPSLLSAEDAFVCSKEEMMDFFNGLIRF